MRLFANTVQRKLLLLLLAVGLLPAAAAVLHVHWGTLVGLDAMLGGALQEQAEEAAVALDQSLIRHFEAAGRLAAETRVGQLSLPGTSSNGRLFREIAIVDSRGRSVNGAASGSAAAYSLPATVVRDDAPDGIFLHEVPHAGGEGSRLLFITEVQAEPRRLLVAAAETSDVLHAETESTRQGQSLSVHSNRGITLAGQTPPEWLIQRARDQVTQNPLSGWFPIQESDDNRFLIGFSVSRLLRSHRNEGLTSVDWLVVTRMNVADATALFSILLWRSVLFGLILVPALIVLSYALARRFLRPIHHLREQVDRVAAGDLAARVSISTGDEIEGLGRAFNDMARGLDFSQAALEEQVHLVEAKVRQLSLVHNITSAIISAFDLPRLFQITHEQLNALLPHDAMSAVVFGRETDEAAVYNVSGCVFSTDEAPLVRFFCEERFQETEGVTVLDSGQGGGTLPPAGPPAGDSPVSGEFRHFCLLPLRAEAGLLGALTLARRGNRRFTETELRTLVQIGQVLAIAVEHIRLYERTRGFAAELEKKVAERATQLEQAQDKLIQAERFAATGRLAASIAHEINNPLGIIKNYLRILRDRLPGLEPNAAEALTVVNEELDRIARIVRNLLYFYRPSAVREAPLDLNEEIEVLLPLMEAGFRRKKIKVEKELDRDLPHPILAPDHIRQVLLNLLKNAEDAVAEGGMIRISTSRRERPGRSPELVLRITDNGCGITPEDLPHIFEPFFTSKRDGQGTGLGLSVTYGIVRNLKGSIDVDSTPGQGTTVTVRLPAVGPAIPVPAG